MFKVMCNRILMFCISGHAIFLQTITLYKIWPKLVSRKANHIFWRLQSVQNRVKYQPQKNVLLVRWGKFSQSAKVVLQKYSMQSIDIFKPLISVAFKRLCFGLSWIIFIFLYFIQCAVMSTKYINFSYNFIVHLLKICWKLSPQQMGWIALP